jgi:hypothetical protein
MKEELNKRAGTPDSVQKRKTREQVYTDLLNSLRAGESFDEACKALSLDPENVWRDFLPSGDFRKEWDEFMAQQRSYARTAMASLRESATNALKMTLQDSGNPHAGPLAYRILRRLGGPAKDVRKSAKPSKEGRTGSSSRSRKR